MTGGLRVKLRRDLRASWSRLALMVIALAITLTVFGSMLFAWSATRAETVGAYLSTEPASATIVLEDGIDAGRVAAIAAEARTRPQVVEATGRTQFTADVSVNGKPRMVQLQVFVAAPDDPMRMVRFDVGQEGSWPPAGGEIRLGADGSSGLLGAVPGDTLTVRTPNGEALRLRAAGTVYDPSLAPSRQEQTAHGYLSASALPAPAVLDQLKIQVAEPGQTVPTRDRTTAVSVAGDVAAWLQQERGLRVAEIQVPKPYAHPHQWQGDVLLLSLLAGGAAALLLASILVANMLNNLFTQQIPQIGIMKAIGAGSARIGRFYLTMTLLVAAVSTLLAAAPAVLLSSTQVGRLTGTLGIEAAGVGPGWWTYLVVLAVGLGLPPLMALPPLLRASRITVRAAIDHHGGSAKPSAATGLLARLSRSRRIDRGLLMALRNTVRRPARFWLSVGLLAGAGTVFVAGMSLRSGTEAASEQRAALRYWDVDVKLAAAADESAVSAALRQVPGLARVEPSYAAPVGVAGPGQLPVTRTYPDQGHGRIELSTVPAAGRVERTLVEGRWLEPGETGAVILAESVRKNTVPGLGAGDDARLYLDGKPTTWRIAGIVQERSSDGGVYTTAEGLAAATGLPRQVNRLRIITGEHDERTRQAVAGSVGKALTDAGLDVAAAASVTRGTLAGAEHLGPVLIVLLAVALPLGVLGAIGLAATMSANILDRTREFGVLHAIGARPKAVRRIVIAEGVFLAITSCFVAVVPALVLTAVLGNGLGNLFGNAALPFRISAPAAALWAALAVLGSVLATDAAATRASRITVREALSYV